MNFRRLHAENTLALPPSGLPISLLCFFIYLTLSLLSSLSLKWGRDELKFECGERVAFVGFAAGSSTSPTRTLNRRPVALLVDKATPLPQPGDGDKAVVEDAVECPLGDDLVADIIGKQNAPENH